MNSSITIAFLTIIGLFVSANACTCLSSDLPDAYHNTFAKRFVKATPLSTFTNSNKRFYLLKIEQEYKACPPLPNRVLASTNLDSAACGIILTLNTPYIMPLNKLGLSAEINLCQYIRHFSSLSEADKSFLDSRQICCNGVCKCANGDQPVSCFRPPCSPPEEPPCEEAVKCVDNYCGGCVAEWFQEDKLPACKERNNIIFG